MKKEISLNEFIKEFKDINRDYYSYEGYKELFDYYDQFPEFELDVIAICCDVTEYENEELLKDYGHLLDAAEWNEENPLEMFNDEEEQKEEYFNALFEEIERQTSIIKLDNNDYLVWSY